MSREMVINTWCELHPQVPAVGEAIITIDRKERLVDLCGDDYEVIAALHKAGIDPKKMTVNQPRKQEVRAEAKPRVRAQDTPSRIRMVDCPEGGADCYHGARKNLGRHLKDEHGTTMQAMVEAGKLERLPRGAGRRKAA